MKTEVDVKVVLAVVANCARGLGDEDYQVCVALHPFLSRIAPEVWAMKTY